MSERHPAMLSMAELEAGFDRAPDRCRDFIRPSPPAPEFVQRGVELWVFGVVVFAWGCAVICWGLLIAMMVRSLA